MALQGSIVITAKVDSGDASKQLQELIGRIEALEGEQAKAARAAANHADKLERLRGVSQAAANTMTVVAAGLAAAGIASIKLAADLEQSRVAFTTLLGSAEKADAFLKDLAKFAASTPFEFVGLQDSARRLLAFGFAAQDIIPLMNSIGSAVAGLGGGKEQIDRVTLALGQMQAKGKVSAEEMNQLAEMGIPGWKMIASAIGVSIPEAMKMAEKGAIDSTTAINALINGMNEKFPGMMEKQSKTINGVFSNLVDGATRTATLIGERLIRAFHVADIIGNAASIIAGFAATIENAGLVAAMDKLFPPGLQVTIVAIAGALTASMIPALAGVATAFGTAVVAAGPFLAAGAAVAALAYTIARNWEGLTGFFSGLFSGISTLVGKLVENIRKPFTAVINWIREKLRSLLEIVSGVLERIGAFVPAPIKQALGNALTFLQTKADDVKDAIGGAVQGVITLGGKAVTAASSGIRALSGLITPDIKAILNAGKAGGVSTAFKGLSGTKPAGAGATGGAAGRAKAGAKARAGGAAEEPVGPFVSMEEFEEHYREIDRKEQELADTRKRLQSETADHLRRAYSMATSALSGDLTPILATIGQTLQDGIINTLAQNPAIQAATEGVGQAVGMTVASVAQGALSGGLEGIASALTASSGPLMAAFSSLGAVLLPLLPVIAVVVGAIAVFQQVWSQNVNYIQEHVGALGDALGAVWGGIMDFMQPVIDVVGTALSFLVDPLTILGYIVETVVGVFTGIRDAIWNTIQSFTPLKVIVDGISWVFNGLVDAVLGVVNWFRALPFVNLPALTRNAETGAIGMKPPEESGPKEMGNYIWDEEKKKWVRKSGSEDFQRTGGEFIRKPGTTPPEQKPVIMPGETPEKPIYTQVVNVRDFREAFPDSAYFRAPSVDTTRSLNANAVAYR
jgi:tape measure domain-containing protein